MPRSHLLVSLTLALCAASCSTGDATTRPTGTAPATTPCTAEGGRGAFSTCLTPRRAPEHYVQQSLRYFDALDVAAPAESLPTYSDLVARWEWPPWLKLTGIGRDMMVPTDAALKTQTPARIPKRDCRAFGVQPFARCRVSFDYAEGGCPIYEEFTFNDQGEITFIEAWSDMPSFLPMADPADTWAERSDVHRLSTRVPGLGGPAGRIDLESPAMKEAERRDQEVADFARRARNFWVTWSNELKSAGKNLFARGCGW